MWQRNRGAAATWILHSWILKRHFVMERQNGYSVCTVSNRSTSSSIIDTWRLPLFSFSSSISLWWWWWTITKIFDWIPNVIIIGYFFLCSFFLIRAQLFVFRSYHHFHFFFFFRLRFKPISYWFYFIVPRKKKWAVKPPSEIIIKLKAGEWKKKKIVV